MFNILSGYETANIKSYAFKAGAVIKDGEWVVFDTATGKFIKQVGAYDPITQGKAFPVFGGNDVRFDSKFMGNVSVITAASFVGETDQVAAVTINPGDPLTIADGVITKATLSETTVVGTIVGYATSANTSGVIEFVRA